jgi:hypothetical protein
MDILGSSARLGMNRTTADCHEGGRTMLDLVFLGLTIASFALSILFVKILGRM